ncbi:hypothetical protein [Wenyingzhuangia marina]|uniref:Short chain amide porin n=1 Tax=Wenyingzhuangia marina TaxID=1195760 RepID=A0A1M5T9T7_9FLAO|nr:hypothetical protein [Wenyingzhuangia marina]GGF65947.1 hypothetical protein GCM10011397_06220 [Wenyingzhuangia marina]SHH47446.1 hypothetical protein SAMN05444281_0769 [Wenyingzhuangia marina]
MKNDIKIFLVFILLSINGVSQEKPKVNWSLTAQIWARYSDLNEGTKINGETTNSYTDVSIRRLRIPVSSQITPKIYAAAMFGGNNFNEVNKKFPLNVLDLYVEYKFDKAIEVGLGKSGWIGLNRWALRSSKTLMGLDSPLFTLNTVNKNDDLARNLGVWFKGQVGKIDYRLIISNPIVVSSIPNSGKVDFANNRPRAKISSYVKYQFWEHESNKSSYQTGTYINSKKVWNIGGGFEYQKKAMSDGDTSLSTTNLYDIKHWSVDSFFSLPINDDQGITAYLGYSHYGFGKNYIRNLGANGALFSGGTDFNGAGVAFPLMGTGNTLYTQFGYAFSQTKIVNQSVIFQPNMSVQYSDWDGLNDKMILYDATLNMFLSGHGHSNKLSLGFQYRPIFDKISLKQKDYKGMLVLQYQISIR